MEIALNCAATEAKEITTGDSGSACKLKIQMYVSKNESSATVCWGL